MNSRTVECLLPSDTKIFRSGKYISKKAKVIAEQRASEYDGLVRKLIEIEDERAEKRNLLCKEYDVEL